jgi:hypothetical protein
MPLPVPSLAHCVIPAGRVMFKMEKVFSHREIWTVLSVWDLISRGTSPRFSAAPHPVTEHSDLSLVVKFCGGKITALILSLNCSASVSCNYNYMLILIPMGLNLVSYLFLTKAQKFYHLYKSNIPLRQPGPIIAGVNYNFGNRSAHPSGLII